MFCTCKIHLPHRGRSLATHHFWGSLQTSIVLTLSSFHLEACPFLVSVYKCALLPPFVRLGVACEIQWTYSHLSFPCICTSIPWALPWFPSLRLVSFVFWWGSRHACIVSSSVSCKVFQIFTTSTRGHKERVVFEGMDFCPCRKATVAPSFVN